MKDLPKTTHLDLEPDNGWLRIWFNQPQLRNALTAEATEQLIAVLEAIRDDREVRGITLRGRGGIFCAGGDLKSFAALESMSQQDAYDAAIKISRNGARLFRLINEAPQFTLVIVEGAAMAGGLGLSCAADAIIAAKGSRFSLTETRIGLSPAQIAPYVIQRLGYAKGRQMMITAQMLNAEQALETGLIDQLADDDSDLERLEMEYINQIKKCAPGAVAITKQVINAINENSRDAQVQFAAEKFADCLTGDEAREGVASFVEKRKPDWSDS